MANAMTGSTSRAASAPDGVGHATTLPGNNDHASVRGADEQLVLPLPLPYDDETEQPIGFALTAKARLTVAPGSVPNLRIVRPEPPRVTSGDELAGYDPDDPSDTRPARARALRRAGLSPEAIASRLQVDDLLVRGWTGEVDAALSRRSPRRGATTSVTQTPLAGLAAHRPHTRRHERGHEWDEIAASARSQAVTRLPIDAAFAMGLALLAGVVQVTSHAATWTCHERRVARRLISWLRHELDADQVRLQVVVRVPAGLAADVTRHEWATDLDLPLEDVTVVRTRYSRDRSGSARPPAGSEDAVGIVRLSGRQATASIHGWLQAFFAEDTPAGLDEAQDARTTWNEVG